MAALNDFSTLKELALIIFFVLFNICNLLCDLFVVPFTKSSISLDAISLQLPYNT